MPNLILVKHSLPEILPELPAREWLLSAEGRRRCVELAETLKAYQPQRVITSREPKAVETGQLLGAALQLPVNSAPNLHEHLRETAPFQSQENFTASVHALFEHPAERVFGEESADEAHARFSSAVEGLIAAHPHENLAIVAHGTVIALFVAGLTGSAPYPLWQQLGLPAFIVLAWPQKTLLTPCPLPKNSP